MDIQLSITQNDQSDWIFRVAFENRSKTSSKVPIDAIRLSGDRVGLRFTFNSEVNSPVGFRVVSPATELSEVELLSGQRTEVQFAGRLEVKAPGVTALCFAHAEYRIEQERTYRVCFVWHDMKSNSVDWRAS